MPRDVGTWYSASVLLVFEPRTRKPSKLVVWENVYLIKARSPAAARRLAEKFGREDAVDDSSLRWNGIPVSCRFAGVKKVRECTARTGSSEPRTVLEKMISGVEATHSQFVVGGRAALRRPLAGKPAPVIYEE